MNPHVSRFIRELHPVDTCSHGGLHAVRLTRANIPDAAHHALPQMVPLSAALAGGAASVSELGDGDVGQLRLLNRSSALLFGMSGELVVGGRQDRVLNSSILIAPGATVPIAVSCIERNRWESAGARRGFTPARATASPAVRSAVHGTVITNLAHTGIHRTNQREVWRKVSQTLHQTGVHRSVPTSTLAGGMDHHAPRLDAYAQACAAVHPGTQLGLALFAPGTASAGFHGFTSIDCFASPVLMQHYAGRLVRGAALEAHDSAPHTMVPAPDATRHLLSALADQHPVTMSPAAGDTKDALELHYCFDGIVASVLCHQDRPVHLAISPVEEPVQDSSPHARPGDTIATPQAMFRVPGPANSIRFIRLPYGTYTLGRSSQCDLRLTDNQVSRTHARLHVGPTRITVRDLNSTNGVQVNDEQVLLSDLNPGDRIVLGQDVELQLLSRGE